MFLSGSFFGEGFFSNSPQTRQEYNDIFLTGGNASCVIDAMHVLDYEMTDDDIKLQDLVESTNLVLDSTVDFLMNQTEFSSNYGNEPSYGENTILYTGFNETLECGSLVTTIDYPLTAYKIRRKEVGDSLNPLLTTITDITKNTFVDYTCPNNKLVVYTVTPYFSSGLENIEGRGLSSDEGGIKLSFGGWILSSGIEATPTISYTFSMENESDEIKVVTDYKKYDTYNTYPTFRWGNRIYKEGALKTIPYNYITLTGQYEITVDLMEAIKTFVNDKNVKILRTPSGEVLSVCTYDFSYKYMDKIAEQPFEIKFSFTEVGAT